MDLVARAASHAALGEPRRLLIVDQLEFGDHTVAELAGLTGMAGNLLAHHLHVLESAGLIERKVSEGDRRKRFITLRRNRLPAAFSEIPVLSGDVLFVCTHNSARSQFAAAIWKERTGERAESAGSDPSPTVHPKAVRVAAEYGIDISDARPVGYGQSTQKPVLVVSVCDRAREDGLPPSERHLHWSVPDPVASGTLTAFRQAFAEIAERVDHLATQRGAA
jgi:ArsR family transcriptional regulator, arsenate/arsenite/antimonite-responsive transcriptional repressor / arsenate reductase (thioredoxin)